MTSVDAIIFGAAGTLANTSDLHYSAYNEALKEAKLPYWDEKHYRETLRNDNGGIKRVKAFLEEQGLAVTEEQCVAIHERKTEIFAKAVKEQGGLKPRPGVVSLLKDAKARGLKTALCSTAHKTNVDLMFEEVEGLSRDLFDLVISSENAGLYGENKPAPDVYLYAMEQLKVRNPVAIEDAQMSVQAPVNAGIPCVAVPGFWCKDHDFSAAIARLEDLPEGASVRDMAALVVPKAAKNLTTAKGASHNGKENIQGGFEVDDKLLGA